MEVPQQMPKLTDLCEGEYTKKQWLVYYKNVWVRNLMARSIDVQTDRTMKKADPEQLVQTDDGRQVPVKERLEVRKMMIDDAMKLIAGIDQLLALNDEELEKTFSVESLKVDEDMLAPSAGKPCMTENNENGRFEQSAPGKFVCIPHGKSVEEYLKEKVEKGPENEASPLPPA